MTTDPALASLRINADLVSEILGRFLQNEVRRAGFRRAVLGLSGGIDSAVVAFLCARALGPENLLALSMPYKTSSAASLADAQAVIAQLGCRTLNIPITDQIDAYFCRFPDASRMRLANKCARERMTVLYDQSAAFDAKSVADLMKALGAGAPAESKDVTITGPDIAENGAVVPVGAATTLAGVKRMLILVEKNPAVLSAMFDVSDAVETNFSTRVKMGQSSNVYAVAMTNDGRVLYAAKEIKVTLGGCGG